MNKQEYTTIKVYGSQLELMNKISALLILQGTSTLPEEVQNPTLCFFCTAPLLKGRCTACEVEYKTPEKDVRGFPRYQITTLAHNALLYLLAQGKKKP